MRKQVFLKTRLATIYFFYDELLWGFVANAKAGRIIAKAARMWILSKSMKEGGHRKAADVCGEPMTDALDHCVKL